MFHVTCLNNCIFMTAISSPSPLLSKRFGPGFILPDYGGRCFAGLPHIVASILGAPDLQLCPFPISNLVQGGDSSAKRVILILVDGFGWRFLERYQNLKPIARVLNGSHAECLTSQFPSTTAAHLTTLHSGVPVFESGIYEWFYHEPLAGRIIVPLPFNDARSDFDGRGELLSLSITPEQIMPWDSFYQKLAATGDIASYVYHSAGFATERNALHGTRGATVRPIDCIEHGFSLLKRDLKETSGAAQSAYHFLYLPDFDSMTHDYGPSSEKLVRCAERIFDQIATLKESLPSDTLLLITADHGHTAVDPTTTIYLDTELPELPGLIEIGSAGLPLVPAGSARDFFLHLRQECRDTVREKLRHKLCGIAEVYAKEQLVELGLFGEAPSQRLLQRLGDTAILPHEGQTVWWSEGGKFKMSFFGHHGGLTADEMLIPLISFRG